MSETFQDLLSNFTFTEIQRQNKKLSMFLAEIGVSTKMQDYIKILLLKVATDNVNERLDLIHDYIGDTGAEALAHALRFNTTLTALNLMYNDIGDIGAEALADALRFNTTLTELNLGSNHIGYRGAADLADALEFNKTITELYLFDNDIGCVGYKSFADTLIGNKTIVRLELSGNDIGNIGAEALIDALEFNSTILTIDIHGGKLDAGKEINEFLKSNKLLFVHKFNQFCKEPKSLSIKELKKLSAQLNSINSSDKDLIELLEMDDISEVESSAAQVKNEILEFIRNPLNNNLADIDDLTNIALEYLGFTKSPSIATDTVSADISAPNGGSTASSNLSEPGPMSREREAEKLRSQKQSQDSDRDSSSTPISDSRTRTDNPFKHIQELSAVTNPLINIVVLNENNANSDKSTKETHVERLASQTPPESSSKDEVGI